MGQGPGQGMQTGQALPSMGSPMASQTNQLMGYPQQGQMNAPGGQAGKPGGPGGQTLPMQGGHPMPMQGGKPGGPGGQTLPMQGQMMSPGGLGNNNQALLSSILHGSQPPGASGAPAAPVHPLQAGLGGLGRGHQ